MYTTEIVYYYGMERNELPYESGGMTELLNIIIFIGIVTKIRGADDWSEYSKKKFKI